MSSNCHAVRKVAAKLDHIDFKVVSRSMVHRFSVGDDIAMAAQLHLETKDCITSYIMGLTGIKSQVVSMNCNFLDDWPYNRAMLQLPGAAGT